MCFPMPVTMMKRSLCTEFFIFVNTDHYQKLTFKTVLWVLNGGDASFRGNMKGEDASDNGYLTNISNTGLAAAKLA